MQRLDATIYFADFADGSTVMVAARSAHMLAERIEWLVGRPVKGIRTYEPPKLETATTQAMKPRQQERLEKLRRLAGQEPPAHDCPLRHEILTAREQLTRIGAA